MNKQKFDDLLIDYVEGSLPEEEAELVRRHAEESEAFAKEFAELKQTLRIARYYLDLVEPPAELDQQIITTAREAFAERAISSQASQEPNWLQRLFALPSFKPAVAFMTVLFVVGSVYFLSASQLLLERNSKRSLLPSPIVRSKSAVNDGKNDKFVVPARSVKRRN